MCIETHMIRDLIVHTILINVLCYQYILNLIFVKADGADMSLT